MKNFYNILGIPENAGKEEINEAFRKLAAKFHPDKNNNDPFYIARFKQINEAKQLLTNDEERAQYDLELSNYADAYHFMQQQHLEEQWLRKERRSKSRVKKGVSRLYAGAGLLLLLVVGLIGFVHFNDVVKETASNNDDEVLDSNVSKPEQSITASFFEDSIPTEAISQVDKPDEQPASEVPAMRQEKKIMRVEPVGRKYTQAEIMQIIDAAKDVSSKQNTDCIQLVQTQNCNISDPLSIATVLQSHGFSIAGRQVVNTSIDGFAVNLENGCLRLVIGKF